MGNTIGIKYPVTSSTVTDVEDLHSTVIFLGKVEDANFTVGDVLSAFDSFIFKAPGKVNTVSIDLFGPNNDIPVYKIESPPSVYNELAYTRRVMDLLLHSVCIASSSDYSYNPHVTVNEFLEDWPEFTLGVPVLWWGDKEYPLNGN